MFIATFFSSSFGMVADRFGVAWAVMAPQATSWAGSNKNTTSRATTQRVPCIRG